MLDQDSLPALMKRVAALETAVGINAVTLPLSTQRDDGYVGR
jgi:hypothetical protein